MTAVWIALVLALVLTLVACGIMLVRKLFRLFAALGDLFSAPAVLGDVDSPDGPARTFAVLESPGVARSRVAELTRLRMERAATRHELRMQRAIALMRADASPIAARLAGLDSIRRKVGGTYAKDDHHDQ